MIHAMPDEKELSRVLNSITGFAGEYKVSRAPIDLQGADHSVYLSFLETSEGDIVGAMLANMPAACMLGGGLVMLPESALEEMIEEGELSDVVLDGLSEVFNMLRRTINAAPENPHVNHLPVHSFGEGDVDDRPWLSEPGKSLKLECDMPFGAVEFAMIAR